MEYKSNFCRTLLFFFCLSLLPLEYTKAAQTEVVVAAASSIRDPLDALAIAYKNRYGISLKIVYGSSGSLAHQILRGAPFDVFLSADEEFPLKIWKTGFSSSKPVTYATGSLGVYANNRSTCKLGGNLSDTVTGRSNNGIEHIAIANPDLAPYGKAAKQALQNAGVWGAVQKKLVFGNSVAQAAQYGLTGAADCSIISHSLSLNSALKESGKFHPISNDLYSPIKHNMVILDDKNLHAGEFHTFLRSPYAVESFIASGFSASIQ